MEILTAKLAVGVIGFALVLAGQKFHVEVISGGDVKIEAAAS